jgi:hypothetical protein
MVAPNKVEPVLASLTIPFKNPVFWANETLEIKVKNKINLSNIVKIYFLKTKKPCTFAGLFKFIQ